MYDMFHNLYYLLLKKKCTLLLLYHNNNTITRKVILITKFEIIIHETFFITYHLISYLKYIHKRSTHKTQFIKIKS